VKSKLLAILTAIAAVFFGLWKSEQAERANDELEDEKADELEDEKAASEYANNATEALIKGIDNENKHITRNGRKLS